jgi:4-hydroxy-2-oxovalerate aldolase
MNRVEILDCTLRDGSYVNRFQFSVAETRYLCKRLEEAGLRLIEVGHGLGLGASRRGGAFAAAATDEEYLEAAAEGCSEAVFGMFCIPGIAALDDLSRAASLGMKLVRIGTNVNEAELAEPFIDRAKQCGMTVCVNYMKSYALPPAEFAQKAILAGRYGADILYIVDSAGGMLPDNLSDYIRAVRAVSDIRLGYHGHNNLGLAVSNTLRAIREGVELADTSLQGLGRSAGNASTEQVLMVLDRMGVAHGIDLLKLLDLGFEAVQPLVTQRGLNPIDLVCGFSLFHSSYIPVISKVSAKYCVDPRELIIELCKVDQIEAPEDLVEAVAKRLPKKEEALFPIKYRLERYFINEQQA